MVMTPQPCRRTRHWKNRALLTGPPVSAHQYGVLGPPLCQYPHRPAPSTARTGRRRNSEPAPKLEINYFFPSIKPEDLASQEYCRHASFEFSTHLLRLYEGPKWKAGPRLAAGPRRAEQSRATPYHGVPPLEVTASPSPSTRGAGTLPRYANVNEEAKPTCFILIAARNAKYR